jgi:hypothetical protein
LPSKNRERVAGTRSGLTFGWRDGYFQPVTHPRAVTKYLDLLDVALDFNLCTFICSDWAAKASFSTTLIHRFASFRGSILNENEEVSFA